MAHMDLEQFAVLMDPTGPFLLIASRSRAKRSLKIKINKLGGVINFKLPVRRMRCGEQRANESGISCFHQV